MAPKLPRAEREAQMLDVAHTLFAERGYAAVTMDGVAAAVGVTKPLLYNYFGNKEGLYLACLDRAGEAVEATVVDAFTVAETPADGLRSGLRAFFAFVADDRATWKVLYDETLPAGGEIAHRVATYRERLTDATAEALLRIAQADGDDVHIEAQALAHALLGACEALVRWWLRTDALGADHAADLLLATLEDGLGRRPPGATPDPLSLPARTPTGDPTP